MFSKTTSTSYLKYGIVTKSYLSKTDMIKTSHVERDGTVYQMIAYDMPVYIEPVDGMGMLRVVNDPRIDNIESFALHRSVKINAPVYFALVPMSMYGSISYNLYVHASSKSDAFTLPRPYRYNYISPHLSIDEIVAVYYMVKRPGYVFDGEVHSYYEFTYVDQGTLETTVDTKTYQIAANQCMLYGPGQYHDQRITSEESCSYLTIIFRASGIHDDLMLNRVIPLTRSLLVDVNDFVKATDDKSEFHNDAMIAALHYLIIALQMDSKEIDKVMPTSPIAQHYEERLVEEIVDYINTHLNEPLPIDQVCSRFSISRSTLQNLFKNNLKVSPKQYINDAKLARSRIFIRSGKHTISEIAAMVGYNSIHYFSRKFTAQFGVTPSEYARRIYDVKDV